ncbi:MAG: regulatory signaling modulator protein AmpE [Pseudomonadota bacterium]
MNLIALGLGLLIERMLTQLLHLREPRWLDRYFDAAFVRLHQSSGIALAVLTFLIVLVPVTPVVLIAIVFRDTLLGVPYLLFAVFVLLFSLGPRDLGDEVDDFVQATQSGDDIKATRVAKELLETDPPAECGQRVLAIEEAIFVQANNRIFGVIFWFMVLGPVGAWLFRVTDLLRRRAIFETGRKTDVDERDRSLLRSLQRVHGLMAFLPSNLVALGYALAGSFDGAVAEWRRVYQRGTRHFYDTNQEIVACAGRGALAGSGDESMTTLSPAAAVARCAMRLVNRTLFVWLTGVAALTLFGLAV